jgi:hypothetical protein
MPESLTASFSELALVTVTVRQLGGTASVDAIVKRLRVTLDRGTELIQAADQQALLALDSSGRVSLRRKGVALASSVLSNAAIATAAGRERFRPFTDYVPHHWLPPAEGSRTSERTAGS